MPHMTEQLDRFYQGINFEIKMEFLPGDVVKYTAIPTFEGIEPGIKVVLAFQYSDKPSEEFLENETLSYIYELTLKKLFSAIETAKEKNILDWLEII